MPVIDDYITESEEYSDSVLDMIPDDLKTQLNAQIERAAGQQELS